MHQWHSLQLGDGILATVPLAQIKEAVEVAFAAAGRPRGMGVFTCHDADGHVHCEVTAFFSPGASEVARQFSARPCVQPAAASVSLLAGDVNCWLGTRGG